MLQFGDQELAEKHEATSDTNPNIGVKKETVLRRYSAAPYDRDMARYIDSLCPKFAARMDARIERCVTERLNEIGKCDILVPAIGSGRILSVLESFLAKGVVVTAFDYNDNMMSAAKQITSTKNLNDYCSFLHADILESVDILDKKKFDLVIWEFSGCVVIDPLEAWKQFVELSVTGGYIVYNDYIGALETNTLYHQNEIRDAARTIGMRWFYPEEIPNEVNVNAPEIFHTNGIISTLNTSNFSNEHAIVWDPTYAFTDILFSEWFSQNLHEVELEIRTKDVMQSNVSAVFRKL